MKISSTNKKILVVSDIHHRVKKLTQIIRHESPDYIICLGDWFDSHIYESNFDCHKTANFLKSFIFQKNVTTLWGNHDLHYFYTNTHLKCSGYTPNKDEIITDVLHPIFNDIKEMFEWYIWVDDILCTHAGLHPRYISPYVKTVADVEGFLTEEINKVKIYIVAGKPHWAYCAGVARGGLFECGGITWLDFNEEFESIDFLRQVVGHTNSRTGKIYTHKTENTAQISDARNICIDCDLDEYLIILNQKLTIKKFIEL